MRSMLLMTLAFLTSTISAAEPMNVLVILADDLGAMDLGCYGNTFHETPNLDAFAKTATRYVSAYSAGPVCSPTRAALMTGLHPIRFGISTWRESAENQPKDKPLLTPNAASDLPLSAVTLAETLNAAGYTTLHVGKWHLGDARCYPEAQGFDLNIAGNHWGAPASHFFPYRGTWNQGTETRFVPNLPFGAKDEYLADRLTDEAIALLRKVKDRPFFLNLCHYAVHAPIQAPESLTKKYQAKAASRGLKANPTYAGMIENFDANVGRVLATLDELNLRDKTLVIITSDNGGLLRTSQREEVTSNAPLRSGKGALYEGGIRVPLLLRWPGKLAPASTSNVPTVTMDLPVTALAAAQLDPPTVTDGVNLVDLTEDAPTRPFYFHFPHYYPTTNPTGGMRLGPWKLIEFFEENRLELYNLAVDPSEATDLAGNEPARVQELHAKLKAWRLDVHARMPKPRG